MPENRNPKTDPRHGDILRHCARERHVISVNDHWFASGLGGKRVTYHDVRKDGCVGARDCSLAAWKSWAKRPGVEIVQMEIANA